MKGDLEARILAAHGSGNKRLLAELYAQAAERADSEGAAGFFLTQAYVFALDAGDASAGKLHARLKQSGREA